MTEIIRQHRTKTIYWILYVSCLHLFRHLAQFVLARRQPCVVLIVQSDEKSDCAIHAQSLCGIAIRRREEMMWEAAKNRDSAAFLALVDENAVMVCGGARLSARSTRGL